MAGERNLKIKIGAESEVEKGTKPAIKSFKELEDSTEGIFSKGIKGAANLGFALGGLAQLGGIIGGIIGGADISGKLQAQLGGTAEQAGELGRMAGDLWVANFGDSMEDTASAVQNVSTNIGDMGKLGEEGFQKASEAALTLKSTFDVDLTDSTNAVGHLMRTGLVKDAESGFDLVTTAFQKIPAAADDGIETLNEYSIQFQKLGLDGPKALGLIAQGMQAGARDTDTIADALKEFSIRAIDGSKTTVDGFKSLGLNAKQMASDIAGGGEKASAGLDTVLDRLRNIKDPVERSRIAVELFGTKAEDLGASLFALDPSTAVAGLGNVAGAAQRAGDALSQGPTAKVEAAKRAFLGWAQDTLATVVIPAITAFVDLLNATLVPVLSAVVGWVKENWSWLSAVLIVIAAMAAPIVILQTAMAAWRAITELVTIAQTALNLVMNANPILLLVTLIAGLVAAFVVLWNKSEGFRAFFIGAWDAIKGAVAAAVNWIKDRWNDMVKAFEDTVSWFGRIGTAIGNAISNGVKGAINWVIGVINGFLHGINWVIDGLNHLPGVNIGHIPDIPRLARGGFVEQGGMAIVGERGREAVMLPAGASVRSNRDTEQMMGGGSTEVHVYIDGQEFRGIARSEIRDASRQTRRRVDSGAGRAV
jgi:phage-related minor tail protein